LHMKTLASSKGSKSTKREKLFTSEFSLDKTNWTNKYEGDIATNLGCCFASVIIFCSSSKEEEAVEINPTRSRSRKDHQPNVKNILLIQATMIMLMISRQKTN